MHTAVLLPGALGRDDHKRGGLGTDQDNPGNHVMESPRYLYIIVVYSMPVDYWDL